jgi:hypothetical protein
LRHFVDGGGHFLHRHRDLRGLIALLIRAIRLLRRRGGNLLARRSHQGRGARRGPDGRTQALLHAIDGHCETAQLVVRGNPGIGHAEIAFGNGVGVLQQVNDGARHAAAEYGRKRQADHQSQQRGNDQRPFHLRHRAAHFRAFFAHQLPLIRHHGNQSVGDGRLQRIHLGGHGVFGIAAVGRAFLRDGLDFVLRLA